MADLTYIPKVYLRFRLPDGSSQEAFFDQLELLRDIVARLGVQGEAFLINPEGKTKLDQNKNVGQLGLKNDDTILLSSA
jgi:hypothetical protein